MKCPFGKNSVSAVARQSVSYIVRIGAPGLSLFGSHDVRRSAQSSNRSLWQRIKKDYPEWRHSGVSALLHQ